MKKVVIVGAGPAGLFAAMELMGKAEVLVIDRGKEALERRCKLSEQDECLHCPTCDVICGVGGAGCMSDGKLNLHPEIGGSLREFVSPEKSWELIRKIDEVFVKHGATNEVSPIGAESLVQKAAAHGIEFVPIKQRHIGSDKLPKLVQSIKNEMEARGVKFLLRTTVEDIEVKDGRVTGVVAVNNEGMKKIEADFVVLAPGRSGFNFLERICRKLNIPLKHLPIDIGVRVEVPAVVYEDVIKINWDPKFRMHTPTYDDLVRTFCTCPYGFVVKEQYDDVVGVNGHSFREKQSNNTNFAFIVRVNLTEPVEDTTAYGYSIAQLANTIGGGKPLIQRLGDLKRGRRSTWERIDRSYIVPTFKDVTPGDISMAMPARIVTDIIEGLDMLDKVVPGVASDSTLLYAPEIKFSAQRVISWEGFETQIKGLYAIGDGAGVSRSIVSSAATGIIAGEHIKAQIEKKKYS
ncbi:MAG: NAD(P)/FAD-dependent oxidoreductase [Methanocellales archaeon]